MAETSDPDRHEPDPRPAEGEQLAVVYRKFDGALHWHEQRFALGTDAYGTWLGAGPNTPSQRGYEPALNFAEPSVMLIPDGEWWTAVFNDEPARIAIYCDITTVPVFARTVDGPPTVTMIDLDLDVVRRRAGPDIRDDRNDRDDRHRPDVYIDDEDEFAEHRVRYGYPAEVADAARAAADQLLAAVTEGRAPFDGSHLPYLERARSLPERIGP